MIEAIVENETTKEKEYLYLKNENNTLFYYGFCISNNEINPIDKNIIQKIYNLLSINDKCVYVGDYLNYKIYLDKKNNIKHFIKNGIEDFLMLFNHNGEDVRVYNISSNSQKKQTDSKKLHIGKFIVSVSINFIILMSIYNLSIPITQARLREGNISNNFKYEFSKIAYSVSDYIDLGINCIDSNDAIELIKNSELPTDLKEILANQNLLDNIFPYYKNTSMEYLIKPKLQKLKLRVYESTDDFITDPTKTDGFYTNMVPNVLNVKNSENYKETAKHEFVHLLQEPEHKYIFLHEAVAQIISKEYFDNSNDPYGYCVLNTSLLMDTIGPKIIWEINFNGDDTNLINILKNNLNESEYNELISYLTNPPIETVENCQRINHIISNLYRNINNKEIREDKNIYDANGYHIKRVYFNEEKMKNNQTKGDYININEIFPDQTISGNKNLTK